MRTWFYRLMCPHKWVGEWKGYDGHGFACYKYTCELCDCVKYKSRLKDAPDED